MTLEAFYHASQMVSSFAVLASLIYLAEAIERDLLAGVPIVSGTPLTIALDAALAKVLAFQSIQQSTQETMR